MPEVVRGSRPSVDITRSHSSNADQIPRRNVHFSPDSHPSPRIDEDNERPPLTQADSTGSRDRRRSQEEPRKLERRRTDRLEDRPTADAYYDSRAATRREFRRRATTLAEYYQSRPDLLPQLPFTWRHGWRRWKLFILIFLIFVDACVVPIVLYYAMKFAGNVEGWIIFAVVATIWGGPTYVEFAVRSWRLIKKEDFYRPLGTKSRWAFDYTHWLGALAIAAVTAFLIIGSAPHIVWLRILALPGPALLLTIGGGIFYVTVYCILGKPAPFRISSTAKGEPVLPGVFYIVEDVVAVNANTGRPYREAIHARYNASPRFRKMMMTQSLFWSVPSIVIAIVLIVLICIHEVDKEVAYGIGWGVPFFWAALWALISAFWAKHDMVKERLHWEEDTIDSEKGIAPSDSSAEPPESPRGRTSALQPGPEPNPPTNISMEAAKEQAEAEKEVEKEKEKEKEREKENCEESEPVKFKEPGSENTPEPVSQPVQESISQKPEEASQEGEKVPKTDS